MPRLTPLILALALWPPCAGAVCLFFINGLGPFGAFTEPPNTAWRSLGGAAWEGLLFGITSAPFISFVPAGVIFCVRRFAPRIRSDIFAGVIGGAIAFCAFVVWIIFFPLDPLLGGVLPVILIVLLTSGAITGFLVARLRPRSNPPTSSP